MKTAFSMTVVIVMMSFLSNQSFGQTIKDQDQLTKNSVHQTGSVKPYPNPAKYIVNIPDVAENTTIYFYNMLGQIVKTVNVNAEGTASVNISDLKNGLYFLEYENPIKEIYRDIKMYKD